jgi:thiamine biosynthesis lipoprotein
MPLPFAEVRRARPLLGTLVEVAVRGAADPNAAIESAFRVVAHVQSLMSYHDPASDLSRLNRQAPRRPVALQADTYEVLCAALALSERTAGAFDVTVAPQLERQGLLPRHLRGTVPGTWRDVECLSGRRVRFRRPLRIDLGGIAKGYAVDRACAALRANGVDSALVNAGGDLRVIGATAWPITVRHPTNPGQHIPLCDLVDGAVATSAGYFLARASSSRTQRALVDGRSRHTRDWLGSISVSAPTCLKADALTKVVGLLGVRAESLLIHERATACIIGANGKSRILGAGRSRAPAGDGHGAA